MSFQISPVDPRITPGFELTLSPAPTAVGYPEGLNGERLEAPDGKLIVQQPTLDARPRTWVWRGYPGMLIGYERQYQRLQTFRSRYRQEAAQSPYCWVKDSSTKRLRRRVSATLAVAAAGSTTSAITLNAATTVIQDPVVEIIAGTGINQIRTVTSMTTTVLQVSPVLAAAPHSATVRLTGWVDDWFRVRVLDVSRKLRDEGGNIRYDTTTLEFVVDDSTYNDLG